jgi:hypothetical protein
LREQSQISFYKRFIMRDLLTIDPEMQAVIAARIEALTEAHANNLIEGLDVGEEILAATVERARQPISNNEFVRREMELVRARYTQVQG